MRKMDRIERLEVCLKFVREHLIMNNMDCLRVSDKIEEALHGYYCIGCDCLLMPENLYQVRTEGDDRVYVHKDHCDNHQEYVEFPIIRLVEG